MAKTASKKNTKNEITKIEKVSGKVIEKVNEKATAKASTKTVANKPNTAKVTTKAIKNTDGDTTEVKKVAKQTKSSPKSKKESTEEVVDNPKKSTKAKVDKNSAINEVVETKSKAIKKTPTKKVTPTKPVAKENNAKNAESNLVQGDIANQNIIKQSIEHTVKSNFSQSNTEKTTLDKTIDNRPSASKQKAEALAKANANIISDVNSTSQRQESAENINENKTLDNNSNRITNQNFNQNSIQNSNQNQNRNNFNRPDNRLDNRPENRNNQNNRFNNNPNSKYSNNRDNRPDHRPDNRLDNRNNQVPPRKISNENPNYQTKGLDSKYGGKPNLNVPKANPVLTKYDNRRPPERAPRFKNPNQISKPATKPFQDFNSPISSLDTNDLKRLQEIEFKNKMRNDDGAKPIVGNRKVNNPITPRKNSNQIEVNNINNNNNNNRKDNPRFNSNNNVNKVNTKIVDNNIDKTIDSSIDNIIDNIIDNNFDITMSKEINEVLLNKNLLEINQIENNTIDNNLIENNLEILVSEDVETEIENKLNTGDIDLDKPVVEINELDNNNSDDILTEENVDEIIKDTTFLPLNVELVTNEENQVVVDLNDELENIQKTIREVKKSTFNEKNKLRIEQGLPPLKINNKKVNNQNSNQNIDKNNNSNSIVSNNTDTNFTNQVIAEELVENNAGNLQEVSLGNNELFDNDNSNVNRSNLDANETVVSETKEIKKPVHNHKNANQKVHQNNPNQSNINKANLNNPNNPNNPNYKSKQLADKHIENTKFDNTQVEPNTEITQLTDNTNEAKPLDNKQLDNKNLENKKVDLPNAKNQNNQNNQNSQNNQNRNQQQKDLNRELEKAVPKKEHLPKPKPIKVTERKMTEAEFKDPFFKKILDNTYRFLRHKLNVEEGTTILVAVSGGVDSVVMLDILYNLTSRYRIGLEIAHYNHNLRGQASIDDEKFVRGLADFYALQYHFANGNVKEHSEKNSLSIETAARGLRYKFFEKVVNAIKCSYLATAHNANDLAETFLLNLTRGSGLTGLSGIPLKRPLTKTSNVIRPIIELKKSEIIEYANRRNLEWREDHTNAETNFTRNKIRHVVLPLLEQEFNPAIIDVINRTAKLIGGADRFLYRFVNDNTNKVISEVNEHTVKINIGLFKTYNHFVQGEIIHNILVNTFELPNLNLNLIDRVIDLVRADLNAKIELTKELKAYRDREEIIITNKVETQAIDVMINRTVNADYDLGTHIFSIKQVTPEEVNYDAENHIEYFDAQFMPQFLNLRAWKDGDSFKPIGMNGNSMKVSDLLTNEKVSAQNKKNVLILTDKVNIIWVVGYRLSEDYKVKPSTKTILKVEIKEKLSEKLTGKR